MFFPERVELEQDPNMQKAEEGNADTASDGGLKTRTSSWFDSADPDGSRMDVTTVGTRKGTAPVCTPSPHK